jgi:uncharacterized protein YndB with AHSA1/START domain
MTFSRAKDQTLSASIRLAAPPEKVWELITTVASVTEWYDTWDTVEPAADDERLQVGTSFRLIRHRGGRDETALCRVTSLQPRRRLCWAQYAPHLPTMSVEFQLLPDTEGAAGTLLKHTRTWVESGDH